MENKNLGNKIFQIILIIEVIAVALVIIFDFFLPTLVILALAAFSLLIRKENIKALGFKKIDKPLKMVGTIFLLSLIWSVILLAFIMPVLNHLLGTTQDLSAFEDLKGNIGKLIPLLLLSWTLAALGEETAYRGYLQKILYDLFGKNKIGIVLTIAISSILFGLAHTEQGIIGVVLTTFDAVILSLVKRHYNDNLWAPVFFHGINNTVGMITFFFIGPIYGFW
ncbi:MAG: type II CAAX endopeptidase family protein [Candidatus Altiarchaeia archaeon]